MVHFQSFDLMEKIRCSESQIMKTTSITVTEASRNFADCVNRAHYQNVTFVLLKNGEPGGSALPRKPKNLLRAGFGECSGEEGVAREQGTSLGCDLRTARTRLKSPANNKWE